MTTTDRGSYLVLDDGRPALRFQRIYDHPIDRVWALVTEPDELAHWFPSSRITLDLTPGGTLTFSGDPNLPDDQSTGRVLEVVPPRRLAFSWDTDELHFDLDPLTDQRTRFTLTHVLEQRNTAARNAAGWDLCLAALDARAAGASAPDPDTSAWKPLYQEYVASGVPSGAAVPGED